MLNYRRLFADKGHTKRGVHTGPSPSAALMKQIKTNMGQAPSSKSVEPAQYRAYVDELRRNWVDWWTCKVRLKYRKVKFFAWRRRVSCSSF